MKNLTILLEEHRLVLCMIVLGPILVVLLPYSLTVPIRIVGIGRKGTIK